MMETSTKSNKKLEFLNNKLLEITNDRGILVSYLLSVVSKIPNPEHSSQFKQVKDTNSNTPNDLLTNKTLPVTLYNNLLTFRDTSKNFESPDLLKMRSNKFLM